MILWILHDNLMVGIATVLLAAARRMNAAADWALWRVHFSIDNDGTIIDEWAER